MRFNIAITPKMVDRSFNSRTNTTQELYINYSCFLKVDTDGCLHYIKVYIYSSKISFNLSSVKKIYQMLIFHLLYESNFSQMTLLDCLWPLSLNSINPNQLFYVPEQQKQ